MTLSHIKYLSGMSLMPAVNTWYGTLNIPTSPNDPSQPYLGSLSMTQAHSCNSAQDTQLRSGPHHRQVSVQHYPLLLLTCLITLHDLGPDPSPCLCLLVVGPVSITVTILRLLLSPGSVKKCSVRARLPSCLSEEQLISTFNFSPFGEIPALTLP